MYTWTYITLLRDILGNIEVYRNIPPWTSKTNLSGSIPESETFSWNNLIIKLSRKKYIYYTDFVYKFVFYETGEKLFEHNFAGFSCHTIVPLLYKIAHDVRTPARLLSNIVNNLNYYSMLDIDEILYLNIDVASFRAKRLVKEGDSYLTCDNDKKNPQIFECNFFKDGRNWSTFKLAPID